MEDPREALRLSRELLVDQERVLGPDHADTLSNRYNMTLWEQRIGDVD